MSKRTFLIAMALLASFSAGAAILFNFQLKGLKVGMTEAELMALYPKAKCETGRRDKQWPASIPAMRQCVIPNFTLADVRASRASTTFLEGKLGEMEFTIPTRQADQVREALSEKIGTPVLEPASKGVEWANSGISLKLVRVDSDSSFLHLTSPASVDYSWKIDQARKGRAKVDL